MHTIGIDPGLTGAVAVLPEGLFFDTPTESVKKGSSKKVYLVAEMVAALESFGYDAAGLPRGHAYIEDVHAMPGQGQAGTQLGAPWSGGAGSSCTSPGFITCNTFIIRFHSSSVSGNEA